MARKKEIRRNRENHTRVTWTIKPDAIRLIDLAVKIAREQGSRAASASGIVSELICKQMKNKEEILRDELREHAMLVNKHTSIIEKLQEDLTTLKEAKKTQ